MTRRDIVLVGVVLVAVAMAATWRRGRPPSWAATAANAGRDHPGGAERGAAVAIPRMVDLGAGRCIPCRKMAPILGELRTEYAGRAEVVFIDVWQQPEQAGAYRFRAIPTQIFYDREGREAWRHEGFLDKAEIVAQFKQLGVE